ncbi:type 11 methyltransferase-like [Tropilaelaps mercedesae]|uniref:Type 11 methyltransferase-like n=1 Tax=Tropilaelaps mercedesae TaxID=418985 RepID=A0A1V9XUZ0_9ACAR|nr:type 11 methyltransferase-like [Tropilaelaps mercedesae]
MIVCGSCYRHLRRCYRFLLKTMLGEKASTTELSVSDTHNWRTDELSWRSKMRESIRPRSMEEPVSKHSPRALHGRLHRIAFVAAKVDPVVRELAHYRRFYSIWAIDFDLDMERLKYRGPELVAHLLKNTLEANPNDKILDYYCASGLVGVALKRQGFQWIDGLDISESMIRIAREKRCYTMCKRVQNEDDLNDYYDFVIICSPLENRNIIVYSTAKLVRVLKPSSYLVVAQPLPNHIPDEIAAKKLIKQVESAANLKLVKKVSVRDYIKNSMGVIAVFHPQL